MLAIERRAMLLNLLKNEKRLLICDMSAKFGVSEETIRRDMEKLVEQGNATRTYGGAIYNEDSHRELPYEIRKRTSVEGKEKMARAAARLIADGEYIMLDDSTTSMYIARAIRPRKNITLITNSIETVIDLAGKVQDWNIHCTGGILKPSALAFTGPRAEGMVAAYHVNTAVISCEGIDLAAGYTDSRDENALLKRAMMSSARRVILAADRTKFGKVSFISIGGFLDIDVLVTDFDPGEEWRAMLEENEIELIVAE